MHVCELICSLLRTPTAQISGVPFGLLRNVIAPHGRADGSPFRRLHHCTNQTMFWPPATASVSMHGPSHAGFLLHMRRISGWDSLRCQRGLWHRDRKCSESPRYRKNTCRGNIGLSGDVRSSLNQHCMKCMLVYVRHDPRHRFSYWPVRKTDVVTGCFSQLAKHGFNPIHLRWRPRWLLTVSCTCVVDCVLVFHRHAVAVLFSLWARFFLSSPIAPVVKESTFMPFGSFFAARPCDLTWNPPSCVRH